MEQREVNHEYTFIFTCTDIIYYVFSLGAELQGSVTRVPTKEFGISDP